MIPFKWKGATPEKKPQKKSVHFMVQKEITWKYTNLGICGRPCKFSLTMKHATHTEHSVTMLSSGVADYVIFLTTL
jgi:hypothetical protein